MDMKLLQIQSELKVHKSQLNKFGGYRYRSCEDILEAVKPLCKKYESTLLLSDEIISLGDRFYVKAEAKLIDMESNDYLVSYGWAREPSEIKGMSPSQITGTASSYARKYALNGLFCIDDTKDADTNEFKEQLDYEVQTISKIQEQSLDKAIENRKIDDETVLKVLEKYGYTSTSEIKMPDYKKIVDEFSKLVQK